MHRLKIADIEKFGEVRVDSVEPESGGVCLKCMISTAFPPVDVAVALQFTEREVPLSRCDIISKISLQLSSADLDWCVRVLCPFPRPSPSRTSIATLTPLIIPLHQNFAIGKPLLANGIIRYVKKFCVRCNGLL